MITEDSVDSWYWGDEFAELEFLRRHKNFISEIERSSAEKWKQGKTFRDFVSEQDGYLCLTRGSDRLGLTRICQACNIINEEYEGIRCLDCKDMELCSKCYEKEEKPDGHKKSHRMVKLR